MKKIIYVETTIPSFYFNQRTHSEMVVLANWTRQWWDYHSTNYDLVSSMAVVEELMEGEHPNKVKKIEFINTLKMLPITSEVIDIVEIYISRKLMPNDPKGDAEKIMILEDDPITAEIRIIRHNISARCNHNLQKILEHYQQLEKEAKKSGKYRFVELGLQRVDDKQCFT